MFLFGRKKKSTIENYIRENLPAKIHEYEGTGLVYLRLEMKTFNLERVLMFQDEEEIMLVNFYKYWADEQRKIEYLLIKKDKGDITENVKSKFFPLKIRIRLLHKKQSVWGSKRVQLSNRDGQPGGD
jgi:hypothetical protein